MPKKKKQVNLKSIDQEKPFFRRPVNILCLLTVLFLLPFINKPFNIDDTLFVRLAEQIGKDPFAPYQFEYTWFATPMSFWKVTQNPPLNSYILAIPGSIFGMNEIVFHTVGILLAVGCCFLMYRIASRLTSYPVLATILTIACPGFFVSATSIMADIPLLFFWLLSIEFTLKASAENESIKLWYACLGIAAASMTKYFGLALIPLIIAYWILKRCQLTIHLLALLVPVLIISAWSLYSIAYGNVNHPMGAAKYSVSKISFHDNGDGPFLTFFLGILQLVENLGLSLSFFGGSLFWPILAIPLFFKESKILNIITLIVGIISIYLGIEVWGTNTGVHFGFMVFGGIGILLISLKQVYRHYNAENMLLLLWIFGTICFSAFINWTVNSRALLISFFPAALLFIRMLESHKGIKITKRLYSVAAVTMLVSLLVAWGDMQFANVSKSFARTIVRENLSEGKTVYFAGHWGFQYYMEQEGAKALDYAALSFENGDLIIYPIENTNTRLIPMPGQRIDLKKYPASAPGPFTINSRNRAGFYSSIWGPVPYIFSTKGDYNQFIIDEFDEKSQTLLNRAI